MNHSTNLYRSAVLAIATAALIGKAALAEDLPENEATESNSNIVLAKAAKPADQATDTQTSASEYADESGVTQALESVLSDSKIELEMRLSGRKSLILTADL
jgi:hypothetical protein